MSSSSSSYIKMTSEIQKTDIMTKFRQTTSDMTTILVNGKKTNDDDNIIIILWRF